METLKGFPNLPALWLRRAKLGLAYAVYGNPERVCLCPRHLPPTLPTPALRAASPNLPALWWSRKVAAAGREGKGVEVPVRRGRRSRRAKLGFAYAVS